MKTYYLIIGILSTMLISCGERRKSTCVCTTTYSGEGSEYIEDETVQFESYNGCQEDDTTISQDGISIRMVVRNHNRTKLTNICLQKLLGF
jgi:prolyl oligopeptidase PreP (S9A serine peptidase family)